MVLTGQGIQAQTVAQADSFIDFLTLQDVVVTAQYAPTHHKNAVHTIRVIQAEEIERQGFNTLDEVLANELSIRVSADPALGSRVRLQGLGGENVQFLRDGVPIIGRLDGNIDLSQINVQNLDRIEIVQGAMATQYGSNAAGGVINIISKQSQASPWHIKSTHQYEWVGVRNHHLSVGWQPHGQWYFNAGVTYQKYELTPFDSSRIFVTDTFSYDGDYYTVNRRQTPWLPKDQWSFQARARHRFSDSLSASYTFRHFDEKLSEPGEMRRVIFKPYAFDNVYFTQRTDHALHLKGYIAPHWYLKSATGHNAYLRRKQAERYDFEEDSVSMITSEHDTTEFNQWLHRSSLSSHFSKAWNGQLGIEWMQETGVGKRISDSTSLPVNQARMNNYAAWLGVRFEPNDHWQVEAALRWGYNDQYRHPAIPSAHIKYVPSTRWQYRLSFAKSFRAPTLKELYLRFIDSNHYIIGNQTLRAEYGQNISADITYQVPIKKTKLQLSTHLFHNHIRDRIALAQVDVAGAQYEYRNVDAFSTHGIQGRVELRITEDLNTSVSYAFTRQRNEFDDAENEGLGFQSSSEWQNEVLYTIRPLQTDFSALHRFIGKQPLLLQSSDGTLQTGHIAAYHLVNVSLSKWLFHEHLQCVFGIKNLLDVQTLEVVGGSSTGGGHGLSAGNQPLSWGRSAFVRLALQW